MNAWWLDAACRGRPVQWWFPPRGDRFAGRVARAVCAGCPVRRQCLDAALAEEMDCGTPFGIRGGRTPEERVVMLRTRRAQDVRCGIL